MAKVITVAQFDNMDIGRFLGVFTQLKLALEHVDLEGLTVDKKEATYDRISYSLRKHGGITALHDDHGFRVYSLRKSELNPKKEVE